MNIYKRSPFFLAVSGSVTLAFVVLAGGCGSSSSSTPTEASRTTTLGAEFKNIPLVANSPATVTYTHTSATTSTPDSITAYSGFSIDVAATLQNMTLSATPVVDGGNRLETLWMLAKLLIKDALAAETASVTAHISHAGDPDVCNSPVTYGPFTVSGAIGSALSSDTERVAPDQSTTDIINAGSFSVCLVGTPPIDGYLTLTGVELDLEPCEPATVEIAGTTWSGFYSCYDFLGNLDGTPNLPIELNISHVSGNSYHYTDGEAAYDGHLCGNEFRFRGGDTGDTYTESGTLVFTGNTATKSSRWQSTTTTAGGTCADSLQRM